MRLLQGLGLGLGRRHLCLGGLQRLVRSLQQRVVLVQGISRQVHPSLRARVVQGSAVLHLKLAIQKGDLE